MALTRRTRATVCDFREKRPPYIAASLQSLSKSLLNSTGISIVCIVIHFFL
uniref:Uncharacterized protein n=1 Tax=uncultured marine virus TaxID=186617 RepID=A0A0F7L7L2_9VIRU|nr:hypothetical protein [uncultured marine virus]